MTKVVSAFAQAQLDAHVLEPHAERMVDAPARKLRELIERVPPDSGLQSKKRPALI
jgi:hypothetical protein